MSAVLTAPVSLSISLTERKAGVPFKHAQKRKVPLQSDKPQRAYDEEGVRLDLFDVNMLRLKANACV